MMPQIDCGKTILADPGAREALENILHEKKVERAMLLIDNNLTVLSLDHDSLPLELWEHFLLVWLDPKNDPILTRLNRDIQNIEWALREYKASNELSLKDMHSQVVRIRNSVSISRVVELLIPQCQVTRNIRCPFHEDHSPSLKVYEKNQYYICFGCQAKGDTIDFVMRYQKCSFREAVDFLSKL